MENPPKIWDAVRRRWLVLTPEEWVRQGRDGRPCLLAECKAPDVPLGREVFAQAVRYNSVVAAPYVLITNGLLHCCSSLDRSTGRYAVVEGLPDLSPFLGI